MTLSQAFDSLEERNGRGSTVLLKSFNNRGNEIATVDLPDNKNSLCSIYVRGCIAGLSKKLEERKK